MGSVMNESGESAGDRRAQPERRFIPLAAMTRVVQDKGRWLVMLNVQSWDPTDEHHPVANEWKQINDYGTEAEANVAASWIERSANRNVRTPNGN